MRGYRRTAGEGKRKSLSKICLFENFIFKPDRSFIQMEMSHLGVQGKQSGSRLKVLESRKTAEKKIKEGGGGRGGGFLKSEKTWMN